MPRFVPRQRKHKVRAREHSGPTTAESQSNQEQIIPLSKDEREEKKQRLREELRAQQPRISSKKQKRLDKYIETKLRKDETIDLLRKLEKEKEKYDASAALQSAKTLGKRSFGEFANGKGPGDAVKMVNGRGRPQEDASDVESEDSFEAENRDAFTADKGEQVGVARLATSAAGHHREGRRHPCGSQ